MRAAFKPGRRASQLGEPIRVWSVVRLVGVLVAALLFLAACGSSSSGGSAASGNPSGGPVTVETHSGQPGTYLTDGAGRTLYLFESDGNGTSTCSGSCATYWPPLVTTGAPKVSGGAKAALLGTITRSDGSKQVTYDGHPLYYYANDGAAGDFNGQGSDGFGAKWWIVSPAGHAITGAGGAGSSASSGSGGGW